VEKRVAFEVSVSKLELMGEEEKETETESILPGVVCCPGKA
jgi:hypothetical protein